MNARTPRPAVEKPTEESDNDDSSDDNDGQDDDGDDMEQDLPSDPDIGDQPMHNHVHPNTIILPVETRPIKELRAGARRRSSHERKRPASYIEESYQKGETVWEEENGELVRGINVLEQLSAHMETDDNDNEARIASQYRILTMHDPEILSVVPEADDENISTRDALRAPDAEQFKIAIIKEVTDLIVTTKILIPLSITQVKALSMLYWLIGTTLKCKRKKKGNGQPDKHKARGAARGDQLTAKILKAGMPLPPTFSPTVKPLTFAFMIQHFYRHYRDALIAEGYVMSNMDNCLFYRITEEETTFIVLFVDDTLIFSKRQQDIDQFVVKMNNHYELTLDTKADSFLVGINISHGTVTLTQPKLLQKLFKEHPERPGKPMPGASTQQEGRTVSAHSSHNVPTSARTLDVLKQESTRHNGSCLFRGYQVH
eukprot:gene61863-biopygen30763